MMTLGMAPSTPAKGDECLLRERLACACTFGGGPPQGGSMDAADRCGLRTLGFKWRHFALLGRFNL